MQGLKLSGEARRNMVSEQGLAGIRMLARGQHHGLVTFVTGEHPAAIGTCRLASRWLSSQLLSPHFPLETAELLVAAVYSGRGVHAPPANAELGFARFLQLLAVHEWSTQPLLVDPANVLKDAQVKAALQRSRARRATGIVPPCFLITHFDTESAMCGDLSLEMLTRACALARSSLMALRSDRFVDSLSSR